MVPERTTTGQITACARLLSPCALPVFLSDIVIIKSRHPREHRLFEAVVLSDIRLLNDFLRCTGEDGQVIPLGKQFSRPIATAAQLRKFVTELRAGTLCHTVS